MQFNGSFEAVVITPAKKLETQGNQRRVQSEGQAGQIRISSRVLIQPGGSAHEQLGNGSKQTPVTMVISVRQIRARESSPESQVIEGGLFYVQAVNNVA